ncbi:hypothetical protein BC830DRAFT_1174640 [Chytriomyces sp. MP71]|nr:hypothetical protein BC830DRAFT_1174640 [Chytriomyces sp. MP71]
MPTLSYLGGTVLSTVEVFPVFHGPTVQYTSQILSFYTQVTNSNYFDWLIEYNTPTQSITRGYVTGSYTDSSTTLPTSINDAYIRTYLSSLVSSGRITPTANTFIPIYFPPGTNIFSSTGTVASCTIWCAYHSYQPVTTPSGTTYNLAYAVLPDMGPSTGCYRGCGGYAQPFDSLSAVSTHELVESVTDPRLDGWHESGSGFNEIGDLCNGQHGSVVGGDGVTYAVQLEFSNEVQACIQSVPLTFAFAFSFTITVSSSFSVAFTVTNALSITVRFSNRTVTFPCSNF